MLADLLGIIAVGLADEPDGIRQQDVALRFLRFVFLPLFVFLSIKKELNTVIDYTQKISVCQNELEILRSSIKDSFINK